MSARLFLVFFMACLPAPALAHAFLQHADPGAGATLTRPPNKVVLIFSEQLEPAFSNMAVTDGAGRSVAAAPPVIEGHSIMAPLRALKPGSYRVEWHAVSVDTHRTEGAYSFTVRP